LRYGKGFYIFANHYFFETIKQLNCGKTSAKVHKILELPAVMKIWLFKPFQMRGMGGGNAQVTAILKGTLRKKIEILKLCKTKKPCKLQGFFLNNNNNFFIF
jgi:hypothetical protein